MSERCKKCGNTREDLIHHRKEVLCREKFAGLDHAISDSCHEFEPTEAPAPSQTEASDACECGDYRSDHDQKGCRVCGNSRAPYDGCKSFRLSRKANEAEQKHWDEFHGPNAGYDGEDHTPESQAAQTVIHVPVPEGNESRYVQALKEQTLLSQTETVDIGKAVTLDLGVCDHPHIKNDECINWRRLN